MRSVSGYSIKGAHNRSIVQAGREILQGRFHRISTSALLTILVFVANSMDGTLKDLRQKWDAARKAQRDAPKLAS